MFSTFSLQSYNLLPDRITKGGAMAELYTMIGKEVEVVANGMVYKGVLIEVSDSEVHIKGQLQWMSLPVSSVSRIKLAGEP
jgi:hypothetical protein